MFKQMTDSSLFEVSIVTQKTISLNSLEQNGIVTISQKRSIISLYRIKVTIENIELIIAYCYQQKLGYLGTYL